MFGAGDFGDRVERTRHVSTVPGTGGGAVGTGENCVNLTEALDVLATGACEVVVAGSSGHAPNRQLAGMDHMRHSARVGSYDNSDLRRGEPENLAAGSRPLKKV